AGGPAVVYQVPAPGEAGRFQVPQVRLSNAAVARRVNRQLLRGVLGKGETETVDAKASPQQQLYQAARECCYDADTRTWAAGGGLTGSEYAVLLNRAGLLSLSITRQYTGAHHTFDTEFLTFDLHTGRRLTLADVVADPPAQLVRRMQGAINRRYAEALATAAEVRGDSATLAEMAELFHWDWSARRVRWFTGDTSAAVLALTSADPEVETFALTPTALLFFHSAGFHRLSQAPEPDDTYRFLYIWLKPRSLLRPLLSSGPTKKGGAK
ncbi:MAG TPA: hypothetical protein VF630_11685, partial [Hymenobacter sp.]